MSKNNTHIKSKECIEFDYTLLIERIIDMFGSQNNFAIVLGITNVSLSKKLNNVVNFTQREMLMSMKLLNIPLNLLGIYFFTIK